MVPQEDIWKLGEFCDNVCLSGAFSKKKKKKVFQDFFQKAKQKQIDKKESYGTYILLRYHLSFLNVICSPVSTSPKSHVIQKMRFSPTPYHLLSSISTPSNSFNAEEADVERSLKTCKSPLLLP